MTEACLRAGSMATCAPLELNLYACGPALRLVGSDRAVRVLRLHGGEADTAGLRNLVWPPEVSPR